MKIEITGEMIRIAFEAHQRDGFMRALEAVAPIIADAALERAAQISDDAGDCIDGADISDAIRALKEPT